jgi:hypothetical protein
LTSYFQYIVNKGLTVSFPWNTFISLYGGKDSQINRPAADSAAYSHRDSLWVFQVSVIGISRTAPYLTGLQNIGSSTNCLLPLSPGIVAFVNGLNTALISSQPEGDFLAYPNYLDPALTPLEAANLY